jgi:hypothetical protein
VDSAGAVSQDASDHGAKIVPVPQMWRPPFPDVAISVREASEALFAYQRRVFRAQSEMRETATRTLETIAQTQALMAQVDAAAAGPVVPVAAKELLDRGNGRRIQAVDMIMIGKKLTELSTDELIVLNARLVSSGAVDAGQAEEALH